MGDRELPTRLGALGRGAARRRWAGDPGAHRASRVLRTSKREHALGLHSGSARGGVRRCPEFRTRYFSARSKCRRASGAFLSDRLGHGSSDRYPAVGRTTKGDHPAARSWSAKGPCISEPPGVAFSGHDRPHAGDARTPAPRRAAPWPRNSARRAVTESVTSGEPRPRASIGHDVTRLETPPRLPHRIREEVIIMKVVVSQPRKLKTLTPDT